MDQSLDVIQSLQCPSCVTSLSVNQPGSSSTTSVLPIPAGASILARYINEGGIQENLDILPALAEEAYLEEHPEARPARAFHVLCTEGDVLGMVELLHNVNDDVDNLGPLIRYQDPLANMRSGLHLAIEHGQEDAVWLLLWLSSAVPKEAFPDVARQAAESIAISRLQVTSDTDIRGLEDAQRRTALTLAQQLRGNWDAILESGILSV
jgi:hypothetical protein